MFEKADVVQPAARPARRLLPSSSQPGASSRLTSTGGPAPPLPKRRPLVPLACKSCRKAKAKCSGDRPACRRCERQRLLCEYEAAPGETLSKALKRDYRTLQAREASQAKILELLAMLPEAEAQHVLARIRAGAPLETISNQLMAGDALVQLAVLPETRFRYKLLHQAEIPREYIGNNPYLDTLLYQGAKLYPHLESTGYASPCAICNATETAGGDGFESPYLMPFHAAIVVDPLLNDAKPSLWTAVCKDDFLMRDLLGAWFRCEYTFTSVFQKDYFLEDMISQKEDFCSKLLVNAVLAYCCVCYTNLSDRAEYWNPESLVYRFLAEAKRLWELEATKPRLTTIQAGIIFTVFHNLCGLDEIGQAYRLNSLSLAHQLELFGQPKGKDNERLSNGKLFTAWALYSWEALTAFSFQQPPLLTQPPSEPLPDPATRPHWYGEIWLKYPSSKVLIPSHFSYLFKSKSDFRIIMAKFCSMAYARGVAVRPREAYKILAELRGWSDGLPSPLTPTKIVLPAQLQLHVYLHHLILAMFEPLLQSVISAEISHEATPQEIVTEAMRSLQTLIRLYYLRHGFEAMDFFIVIPLIYVGFKCLDAINEQTPLTELELMRSTLILVVDGLYHQRRNHYLSEALYRVVRGRMRPQEASLVKETLELDDQEDDGCKSLQQAVRSHWPVSIVKRKADLESHMLANLVRDLNLR